MTKEQAILLVDDSENDILLLRLAFKKADFLSALQEVHNGEEAIAYLKGEGIYKDRAKYPMPSLILLDLNMPKKNGFDVLAWVEQQTGLKHLTIIVMTASTRPEDIQRAHELGACSYLVKPSSMEELASMVRCLRDWIQINHFPPPTRL